MRVAHVVAVCCLAAFAAACAGKPSPATPAGAPAPATDGAGAAQDLTPLDPVETVIEDAESHYLEGQEALELGHLEGARASFDRAVLTLLEAPGGVLADKRLKEAFDDLVTRIASQEAELLASADIFTELDGEPASIDVLLAASTFAEVAPAPELEAAVGKDLERAPPEMPIPLNAKVLSYVKLFQGRLREQITTSLTRGSQYLPMIHRVFQEEGVPLELGFVPIVESAYKPTAVSRARARGMWQFMAPTATEYGLTQNWYVDERSDPEKATRAAARYLKALHEVFDDWHLALAAYNGGPGRITRALRRTASTDFWDLAARRRALPRETREYVPMVLAAMIVGRNPAEYDLEIPDVEPLGYDSIDVPQPIDLRTVAEWAGVAVDDIVALNPELRRITTPLGSPYSLKVPAGTGQSLGARLARATPDDFANLSYHVVQSGESLWIIGRRYGVSWQELAQANRLSRRSVLGVGQELVIPHGPEAGATRASLGPAPSSYTVRRGDTLTRIARQFGVTVATIKTLNRLTNDRIHPGERLALSPR